MQQFEIGKVVQSKAGGPKMLVIGKADVWSEREQIQEQMCKWYDSSSNSFKSDHFPIIGLVEVAED